MKKILSFALILSMILTMFTFTPMTASAALSETVIFATNFDAQSTSNLSDWPQADNVTGLVENTKQTAENFGVAPNVSRGLGLRKKKDDSGALTGTFIARYKNLPAPAPVSISSEASENLIIQAEFGAGIKNTKKIRSEYGIGTDAATATTNIFGKIVITVAADSDTTGDITFVNSDGTSTALLSDVALSTLNTILTEFKVQYIFKENNTAKSIARVWINGDPIGGDISLGTAALSYANVGRMIIAQDVNSNDATNMTIMDNLKISKITGTATAVIDPDGENTTTDIYIQDFNAFTSQNFADWPIATLIPGTMDEVGAVEIEEGNKAFVIKRDGGSNLIGREKFFDVNKIVDISGNQNANLGVEAVFDAKIASTKLSTKTIYSRYILGTSTAVVRSASAQADEGVGATGGFGAILIRGKWNETDYPIDKANGSIIFVNSDDTETVLVSGLKLSELSQFKTIKVQLVFLEAGIGKNVARVWIDGVQKGNDISLGTAALSYGNVGKMLVTQNIGETTVSTFMDNLSIKSVTGNAAELFPEEEDDEPTSEPTSTPTSTPTATPSADPTFGYLAKYDFESSIDIAKWPAMASGNVLSDTSGTYAIDGYMNVPGGKTAVTEFEATAIATIDPEYANSCYVVTEFDFKTNNIKGSGVAPYFGLSNTRDLSSSFVTRIDFNKDASGKMGFGSANTSVPNADWVEGTWNRIKIVSHVILSNGVLGKKYSVYLNGEQLVDFTPNTSTNAADYPGRSNFYDRFRIVVPTGSASIDIDNFSVYRYDADHPATAMIANNNTALVYSLRTAKAKLLAQVSNTGDELGQYSDDVYDALYNAFIDSSIVYEDTSSGLTQGAINSSLSLLNTALENFVPNALDLVIDEDGREYYDGSGNEVSISDLTGIDTLVIKIPVQTGNVAGNTSLAMFVPVYTMEGGVKKLLAVGTSGNMSIPKNTSTYLEAEVSLSGIDIEDVEEIKTYVWNTDTLLKPLLICE